MTRRNRRIVVCITIAVILAPLVFDRLDMVMWSGRKEYRVRFTQGGRDVVPKVVYYEDCHNADHANLILKFNHAEGGLYSWRDRVKRIDFPNRKPVLEVYAGGERSGLRITNTVTIHRTVIFDVVLSDNTHHTIVRELPEFKEGLTYREVVTIVLPEAKQ